MIIQLLSSWSGSGGLWKMRIRLEDICCCGLPCNHCSNWTWVVEEILAFGTRLRSTHCREFNYLKLCRPAYFVRTTQLYQFASVRLTLAEVASPSCRTLRGCRSSCWCYPSGGTACLGTSISGHAPSRKQGQIVHKPAQIGRTADRNEFIFIIKYVVNICNMHINAMQIKES